MTLLAGEEKGWLARAANSIDESLETIEVVRDDDLVRELKVALRKVEEGKTVLLDDPKNPKAGLGCPSSSHLQNPKQRASSSADQHEKCDHRDKKLLFHRVVQSSLFKRSLTAARIAALRLGYIFSLTSSSKPSR